MYVVQSLGCTDVLDVHRPCKAHVPEPLAEGLQFIGIGHPLIRPCFSPRKNLIQRVVELVSAQSKASLPSNSAVPIQKIGFEVLVVGRRDFHHLVAHGAILVHGLSHGFDNLRVRLFVCSVEIEPHPRLLGAVTFGNTGEWLHSFDFAAIEEMRDQREVRQLTRHHRRHVEHVRQVFLRVFQKRPTTP